MPTFDKNIDYIKYNHIHCSYHRPVTSAKIFETLQAAIEDRGITAVRAALKEDMGNIQFVTVQPSGKKFFKKYSHKILLDFEEVYILPSDYHLLLNGEVLKVNGVNYRLFDVERHIAISDNHPRYYGYPLITWILEGQECPDCGVLHIGNREICPSCARQYQTRSYNTHVEDELGFENTKEIRFGVELEYEKVTAIDVFSTLKGHALPKRDGSINEGVEIVTRPAKLATHKDKLKNFYSRIKVKAASNTGMHVHIERSKLSQLQIGFMMEFLNNRNLVPFISVVAGRQYADNHYCRAQSHHNMTFGIYFDEREWKLKRQATDKYSPFNTAKPHTVEIRIFSSPTSHEECAAKLDFVAALVEFSSPYSVSVKSLKDKFSWDLFLTFVQKNKHQYKDFFNFYIKPEKFKEVRA